VAAAVVLSTVAPTNLLRAQTTETNAVRQESRSVQDLLKGGITTTFASEDVRIGGKVIGKGSVGQMLGTVDIGDNFSVGTWLDASYDKKNLTEWDLSADVHGKLLMPKTWISGDSPFSWSLSLQRWYYPSGSWINSGPDHILIGSVAYKGFVDAKITFTERVTSGSTLGQNNTDLDLSKQFSLGRFGKCKFYVSPTLRIGYDNRWFGGQGEFLTPGIVLGVGNTTETVRFEGFLKTQRSLNERTIQDIPGYGGFRFKFSF